MDKIFSTITSVPGTLVDTASNRTEVISGHISYEPEPRTEAGVEQEKGSSEAVLEAN